LTLGLIFISCDNGTTGDGQPEIENTFYIGRATAGDYNGMYFYIGKTITSSNTPDSIFSMGYQMILGNNWYNTPDWKSSIDGILSNYNIKKNGKSVYYSDLPDYSGSGGRDNRKQHRVFAVR